MKYTILLLVPFLLACGTVSAITTPTPQASRHTNIVEKVDEETQPIELHTWTVCAETLYVRGNPSTSSKPVRWLTRGEVVRIHEWSHNGSGWAMIAPAEWVNGDYLCPPQ